jgi:uncharacterized RmlC-like cupin family protein
MTKAAQRLRVVRATDRRPDTASGAMVREAAISRGLVGAEQLWVGYVELPPGMRSAPHHHGDCESAIYIISGSARFLTGDGFQNDAGDAGLQRLTRRFESGAPLPTGQPAAGATAEAGSPSNRR